MRFKMNNVSRDIYKDINFQNFLMVQYFTQAVSISFYDIKFAGDTLQAISQLLL